MFSHSEYGKLFGGYIGDIQGQIVGNGKQIGFLRLAVARFDVCLKTSYLIIEYNGVNIKG